MKAISASGVVALRQHLKKGQQVLLVHRPSYDDWTLPKGKLERRELLATCAARETLEETGVTVRLGQPINLIKYPVGGGLKTVYYWNGVVQNVQKRKPDGEIDKVKWLTIPKAMARLTYPDEKGILDQALAFGPTTPFIILRHGQAMLRRNWHGDDQLRPLVTRGREQALALMPLLGAYGVTKLSSSSSKRCVSTLKPYAKDRRLEVETWSVLSEEQGEPNPKAVTKTMKRLALETAASGEPRVVCGHRPVLPTMLSAVGVTLRSMKPGALVVAHLAADGRAVATEWY